MAYNNLLKNITVDGVTFKYYDLPALKDPRYDELPISIRYVLEAAVRHCDGFHVLASDVETILDWKQSQKTHLEILFKPARVILQDFTGVPAIVDLAAMREAVQNLGGDPSRINPACPVDLVVDHSIQADSYGSFDALDKNQRIEFERNKERFNFLKWGSNAFDNLLIVPPGVGIIHQVNLEYLSRVVFVSEDGVLYPDSVVGADSHTTMVNGSGVLGWGVGGIEAEAVMLGQPISMVIPEVIGCELVGCLADTVTTTDLVLTITESLRVFGVVGKFVEFFGEGVASLSIADRATIANMCPEYGATVGFFPVDWRTVHYLLQSGRDESYCNRVENYLKANRMFVEYGDSQCKPTFTKILTFDLRLIVPSLSGPRRPQDRIDLSSLHKDFSSNLTTKFPFKGFGLRAEHLQKGTSIIKNGSIGNLTHGSVVIAAITSCTNTSNPSVMLAAGLVAKKAVELGLSAQPFTKTSLSPGSRVVTKYLKASGLLPYLQRLGFHIAGYGCMTCIGNSGPLDAEVSRIIEEENLVVAGMLSGNRNFEGRIHPLVRANYLASPPLVVAYSIIGNVSNDISEVIATTPSGRNVYFKDIWPTKQEVTQYEEEFFKPQFFKQVYAHIEEGSDQWQQLQSPVMKLYPWDCHSTYIKRVPFFENMTVYHPEKSSIVNAYVLLYLGDSVTTDHISPAGSISKISPAARFLEEKGCSSKDFNTYGARRGNDEIMTRGTFANIRLANKLASRIGPQTLHIPSGKEMDTYDAAMKYASEGHSVIVIAGKEYGCGSSRDWAAKGPYLLGVKAILAESFERIHRSNLIGMGIVPLQFKKGENAKFLGLTGKEQYTITIPNDLKVRHLLKVTLANGKNFEVICRIDTEVELTYYRHGGILQYMIRKLIK